MAERGLRFGGGSRSGYFRSVAGLLAGVFSVGIVSFPAAAALPSSTSELAAPVQYNVARYGAATAPVRMAGLPSLRGMSRTKKTVLLLAGAAALYYMYSRHKSAQGQGPQGQYYRSKNGRIYYRDKNHRPVWVTAPQQPMQVSAAEYKRYTGQDASGYNGQVMRQAPAGW